MGFQPLKARASKIAQAAIGIAAFLFFVCVKPLGMNFAQSAVTGGIVMAVLWWTLKTFNKIFSSVVLLAIFTFLSGVSPKTVYSFPLGETFYMIVFTYLFSQALVNAGITSGVLTPLIRKFAVTPFRCIVTAIVLLVATIPVIPQPLARLIIVAGVFSDYLDNTDVTPVTKTVIMYAIFAFYAVVNMSALDADIIMNNVAAQLSGVTITNGQWIRAMAVPTALYCAAILLLFSVVFRKEIGRARLTYCGKKSEAFDRKQKITVAVVLVTVILWMTQSLHHINATLITVTSVAVLFALKVLMLKDLKCIDVTTLVFLTAAFSIGGVMKGCGAAEIVFGLFGGIFPSHFSVLYLLVMTFVVMALHMVLGSNTTTLSVVVPGLEVICGGLMPADTIMYVAIAAVSFHAILPFHSVALMVGSSNGYYPDKYVSRFGIPATPLVFLSVAVLFYGWWRLIGIL